MSGRSQKRFIRAASLLGAVLGLVLTVAAPAAAAGPSAVRPAGAPSPGHSPLPVFSGAYGVSCPSALSCIAVGGYNANGVIGTLTEAWDGSAWSVSTSPNPTGAASAQLNAVSCASDTQCLAVGTYSDSHHVTWPLAEAWDGSSWSLMNPPTPAGGTFAALNGVSCPGAGQCVAVGSYTNSRSRPVPLVEAWDGTAWAVQHVPHPATARASGLAAVSCAGSTACMATGSYFDPATGVVPLAEAWNGTAWSVVPAPSPAGAQGSYLVGVSCPSASWCAAIGDYFNADGVRVTLAETWDGADWSVVASPNPTDSPSSALYGVACSSPAQCLAVGHSYSASAAGKDGTLAESWDGAAWTIVASPSPSTNSMLSAVSCAGASHCVAVGSFFNSSNDYQTLAESWNGSAMSITNQDATLSGVSCPSGRHCVAVGSAISGQSVSVTLAEVQTGRHWRVVDTPNPADSEGSYLSAVDCPSADRCVAVGYYYNLDNTRLTLVEAWDGRRWTIVPSPSVDGAAYSVLYGVTCTSASSCVAVGSAAARSLAESWDGTAWTIVRTRDSSNAAYSELNDVACTSAMHCMAVGYETDTYYHADLPVAEQWDGSRWSLVRTPAPGKIRALSSVLHGVSCPAADQCLAVGYHQRRSGAYATFTERWTGQGWVVQSSATPAGAPYADLNGIDCVTASRCLAVGSFFAEGAFVPLGEAWTGSGWNLVAGPPVVDRPAGISYLTDVACAGSLGCSAVGAAGDPANLEPLTQQWR